MEIETIKEFVNDLTNTYSGENRKKLLEVLRNLHPTLQQAFTGYCLAWINELPECNIDDRNRASSQTCKQLKELYCTDTGADKIRDNFPIR